ncbi:site-specific DNA-methyltransferase [Pontibacter actiniarum]|uniref:site-specific DNA-methyltransferase (adenine-specific) n=1 Tax=Pontibacter actiniarum TaxID=323450 RepID=A0A1X9YYI1_9BACT|nr:site-specific DNA-methyltransferase [Pontibacter actiniarum]ARS38006.1 site-specific DNA-methyltransferase [Pontibacter actiniarum]
MPTLHWIGKEKVVNHHRDVPFRVLEPAYTFITEQQTAPAAAANKIIHGDNLEALKALLPEYEGKVKCIYIDPPYNTGNESWVYNDNVNDPKIQRWLQQVVGKEGEDLTRHDKWLCMMYPRLKLLHKLLASDGAIFISIDDNAQGFLRPLVDEVFGVGNFVTNIIWEKADSPRNSARQFSTDHDYIMVYSKNTDWVPNRLPRDEASNSIYSNPDKDPRGPWLPGDPYANKPYSKGLYTIEGPTGRSFSPPQGRFWRISEEKLRDLDKDGRIWWGPNGSARPSIKRYLSEVSDLVPRTLWKKDEVGSNRTSKNEINLLFPESASFDTPKPSLLIERILRLATDKESIILDSFAGSGTTAHAVLNLNKEDGGNRRFILVEMEDYAEGITAERVKRVMQGYGEGSKAVAGTGGDFTYYTLGPCLFDEENNLNEAVGLERMRQYIWYSETRSPYPAPVAGSDTYFLGSLHHTAYYFVYEPNQITNLDYDFLATVTHKAEQYVMYADNCLLPKELLQKYNIVFKKIPRDISRF